MTPAARLHRLQPRSTRTRTSSTIFTAERSCWFRTASSKPRESSNRPLRCSLRTPRAKILLAGVYFRLGVYPRSIEIWSRLVGAYPRDATLRVNLALALLKTGQPAVAAEHLRVGVQLDPEHRRAWGYLGLTHWRLGRFVEARDAFVQGGQMPMARRMEDAMGSADALPNRLPSDPVERGRIRSLMDQAIERFESEQIAIQPAISGRAPGAWTVAEPGNEHLPSDRPLSALPEAIHPTAFDPCAPRMAGRASRGRGSGGGAQRLLVSRLRFPGLQPK